MNPIRETIRFITNEDDSIECLCNRIPVLHVDECPAEGQCYLLSLRTKSLNLEDVISGDEEYAIFEVVDSVNLLGPYSDDIYHPWRDL